MIPSPTFRVSLPASKAGRAGEQRAWSINDRELCDKSLAIFIATGKGWIRTDSRPDKSTFAFCLQAVKNQGFSLPIQSQYSFWSEHFNETGESQQKWLNISSLMCAAPSAFAT